MKSLFLMMAATVALIPLTGCETLTDTPGENANRIAHATITNWRQLPDDTERILLIYQPLRLTDKPVPNQ